ncbi:hypothetical protein PR003_g86 [Phytophthora rubi]|uniref:Uncharacterized protein n=1 Tax=Phytophthora rubi TaxID=129364 RepID=A0A6A4G9N3_9STRA|nr:hypothetical protein PR002_g2111 [Phytophthora rubi]KAE9052893.1 hypothetical protein PR001_g82 [Phytophthora rubi]KAE9360628.1 hypothetical protein PR003_g86 [Phytophthora rubi]
MWIFACDVFSRNGGSMGAIVSDLLADTSLLVKIEDLFTEAAGDGNVKELVSLFEQGARINDTDKEGYAALQVAAKKGRDECVTFLLQEGADVNQRDSDGFSALHEAAFWGHDNVARILLRHGADKTFVNSEGTTALDLAVRHGNGVIAHMLSEGHSVERGFY